MLPTGHAHRGAFRMTAVFERAALK